MRFTRLFSATALVAAATLLASCGESSSPTTAAKNTDASAALGPREFPLSPAFISWDRGLVGDPIPTDTKSVLVGGILPLASYPSFGTPVYTGGADNWLDINTTPSFSLNPMGWVVRFKLKPAAQFLPEGSYSAAIPVMVPAATNNPQTITVSFGCPRQLVVDGPSRTGNLTAQSAQWSRSSTFNGAPAAGDGEGGGSYAYEDWCITVGPSATVYVWMQGGYPGCPVGGTLYDSYLYAFTQPDHTYVTSDDDAACGYDSQIAVTNNGAATKQYLIRATDFSPSELGTYTISAKSTPYSGPGLRQPGETKKKIVPGQ